MCSNSVEISSTFVDSMSVFRSDASSISSPYSSLIVPKELSSHRKKRGAVVGAFQRREVFAVDGKLCVSTMPESCRYQRLKRLCTLYGVGVTSNKPC